MEYLELLNKERDSTVNDIVSVAINEVARKYGTGRGDGQMPLAYHNSLHTTDVIIAARKIIQLALQRDKATNKDVDVVVIAASYHDIEQALGRGRNEDQSKLMCAQAMLKSEVFKASEIITARRMIDATKVTFKDGAIIQSATDAYLTQVLADADLASLGAEPRVYWNSSYSLLKEMNNTYNPEIDEVISFAQNQIKLLTNHMFYTLEAQELFPHKNANIMFTKQLIKELRSN